MTMGEAWDATEHGSGLARPCGYRLEKWAASLESYVDKNHATIPLEHIMAGDWSPD